MSSGLSRRRLLAAAGGTAGAIALSACSSSGDPTVPAPPAASGPDRLEGDLAIAALLVSIENLLVLSYDYAIEGAAGGRFGAVPPAALTAIETLRQQHREHAAAWNGILTGAGRPGITGSNTTLKAATDPVLVRVREANGLLTFALDIENVTAATYLAAVGGFQNNAAIKVAASIHPVEAAHTAELAYLAGRYPGFDAFARTEGARTTSDAIG